MGNALTIVKPSKNEAADIGKLYQLARSSVVDSVKYCIEAGRRLAAKKQEMKHGEWMPWLSENADVLGFETDRTAQRLIKLSANPTPASDLDGGAAVEISRKLWGHENVRGTTGTGENEWYTPGEYVNTARGVLGGIDVDPASSAHAQLTVKAEHHFTEADNGLDQEWHGRIWLNPPYAQPAIGHFADKMCAEIENGHVDAAIMLTHNYTDTAWFQKLAAVASAICFTRGRVKFVSPTGEIAAPTQGQAFFYFGDDVPTFVKAYAPLGFVMVTA